MELRMKTSTEHLLSSTNIWQKSQVLLLIDKLKIPFFAKPLAKCLEKPRLFFPDDYTEFLTDTLFTECVTQCLTL